MTINDLIDVDEIIKYNWNISIIQPEDVDNVLNL